MDADTGEKMTETSKISKDESESKSRGRGSKVRGRGGRMSRGGMRGGRGMMKGFGPPGYGRGRMKDGSMNGLAPMRGMVRMRPYPDLRGHRSRGGPVGMGPPPPPPPPPPHLRGPFSPIPRVILVSEGVYPILAAEACHHLDLHTTSTPVAQEATTMDRSLRLTRHLAEARGGQGPLVADIFKHNLPYKTITKYLLM
ncbi:hypothetical protein EXN66_Car018586 [Channa argus]|uniref:Uncharacterized protein n=1 Tax=Channa argus TaxID=215402 RepID=A0A6G1QKY2_CHAAH|nr:hypothetical protein EXN66_Car018586 [Channa argus]KAK2890124.1 hypothetical protein Q8A73_018424 [Channa argus]